MTFLRSRVLQLFLVAGIFIGQSQAQVADVVDSGEGPNPAADGSAGGSSGGAPSSGGWEFSESPALVVPGVIALRGLSGAGLVLGTGLSGGYGQISSSTPGDASGFIAVAQPYAGLFQTGPRHKVLLEYSPTINFYNNDRWEGGVLQRAGFRGFTDLSRRWRWVFAADGTSGTEYLRELSGLGMGLYPGWLTFTAPSNVVRAASAITGLHWRRKPLQEFSFTVANFYSSVKDGPHYDAGLARLQMTNYFGRDANWYVFTEGIRYSNQPNCTRIVSGAGISVHFNTGTMLGLEGAPVYGTGDCTAQWTAGFSGRIVQRITPKTFFYLTAGRDLMEPYLLQSRWTDIFSARFAQGLSRNTRVSLGAGYAVSSDLPDSQLARYRGFQATSEFNWRLAEGLKLVATYRYFKRDFNYAYGDDTSFHGRNSWAFLSLVWHPMIRRMGRSD